MPAKKKAEEPTGLTPEFAVSGFSEDNPMKRIELAGEGLIVSIRGDGNQEFRIQLHTRQHVTEIVEGLKMGLKHLGRS